MASSRAPVRAANHHQIVHWRAGGAIERFADFLVCERTLALIVRRGGFRYLNPIPDIGLDKLPVT
jgi:hypothetical protein